MYKEVKEDDLILEKETWNEGREKDGSEERRKVEEKEGREAVNHKEGILMLKGGIEEEVLCREGGEDR